MWRITIYFSPLWSFYAGYSQIKLLEKIPSCKRNFLTAILVVILTVSGFLYKIDLAKAIKEHERQCAIMDMYSYINKNIKNLSV